MFTETFVKILRERNITPYKVAKETCIPKSTLYEWAAGEREPVSEYLVPLADYLGCSVDYLLGRTDNPKINQ